MYIFYSSGHSMSPTPLVLQKDCWSTTSNCLLCTYSRMQQMYSGWPSLQHSPAQTVLQSVLQARRARKTSQSGEDVWPVHLEAALLEGLESYVPDDSRETRVLGRFRGRNQFISEYIFSRTGVRRSNKQVGSRLQQLRHCTSDPKLRRLLTPFRPPKSHNRGPCEWIPTEDLHCYPQFPQNGPIWIPILPRNSPDTLSPYPAAHPFQYSGDNLQIISPPRPLESITPTITFLSPYPVTAQSQFVVWYRGQAVHTETVPLIILMDEPDCGTGFLHRASFVPAYWNTILASPDPSDFIIFQEVATDSKVTVFSAEYRFVYREHNMSEYF
ncbi:hypothetical protein DFH07DRAFT_845207 [Mycena maculata]|uniref:TEA domain-containing protein n=1 Tax=Mycena maculata TaxID=230809 RepID=A0AAD7I2S9_9AGAR|nr:hypothetical protein DFH07DRAFT_845207 [Mycena maculata]